MRHPSLGTLKCVDLTLVFCLNYSRGSMLIIGRWGMEECDVSMLVHR
jgi:hypothetical protein